MAQYKEKYKQYVINSSKATSYFFRDDVFVINLNACLNKKGNYIKYMNALKEGMQSTTKVNLCNFASLCYKLHISYVSREAQELLQDIINTTREAFPEVKFVQNGIDYYGEIDIQPLHTLLSFDREHNYIYVNSILLDALKILGYVNCQMSDIIKLTLNLNHVIPVDITATLPITTKENMQQYALYKELLCSQDMLPMKN